MQDSLVSTEVDQYCPYWPRTVDGYLYQEGRIMAVFFAHANLNPKP